MAKTCYYCGQPSVSKEHVPPKQMFAAFNCDRITVHSCSAHNTDKSGEDHAIVTSLLTSLNNMRESGVKYPFLKSTTVIQAIDRAKDNFHRAKRLVSSRQFIKDPEYNSENIPNMGYLQGSVNIVQWMKQLTAALVFDANNEYDPLNDWSNAKVVSFDFWNFSQPLTINEAVNYYYRIKEMRDYYESLPWVKGWAELPKPYPKEIYHFLLHFEESSYLVTIKHKFYDQFSWFVRFTSTEKTIAALRRKQAYFAKAITK